MAKVLVVYDHPINKEGFDDYYFSRHIPLAEALPNIKRVHADRVVAVQNSETNPYLIVQLEFENPEAMNQALTSEQGKALTADTKNFIEFLSKPPATIVVV